MNVAITFSILLSRHERQECSGCCRWVLPSKLTLTAMKRLYGAATGAGPNGGCKRYCGHMAFATRLAPRHRPFPHLIDCCTDT